MTQFLKYNHQSIPEELIDDNYLHQATNEIVFYPNSDNDVADTLDRLYYAKTSGKTILAYCYKSDGDRNLYVTLSDGVTGIVPHDEVSYQVMDDGLVHKGLVTNRVGLYVRCLVKDIESLEDEYKVTLSRKDAIIKAKNRYYNDLKRGMVLEGVVTSLTPTEAIISIGADVVGILGVRNIARVFIDTPSEILSVNQRVQVVVDKIFRDNTGEVRFEFNRKKLLPTFKDIYKKYNVGDIVIGTVKGNMGTGYFVKLDEVYEGVAKFVPNKRYKNGDQVKVLIKKIDIARERINLAIK
jgi:ribosomal protein S1